ncbi:MAG: PDZ domain-containing protein [Planctomycetota bacterium]
MNMLPMVACSLVTSAGLMGIAETASAGGLVGFYVYPDSYGRGLLISSFIPGSSADNLYRQGELRPGDIITRYNGQQVFSVAQVRAISTQLPPGECAKMEFLTSTGQPFWHWVWPGGGVAAAPSSPEPIGAPSSSVSRHYRFQRGSGRPGGSHGRPNGPSGPGRPRRCNRLQDGPGRP